MKERTKMLVVSSLTVAAIALTLFFHLVLHTSVVFTHFFYIPIIIAVYWFGYWGMIVPGILAVNLIITDLMVGINAIAYDDILRSVVFTAVAAIIASVRASAISSMKALTEAEERYRTVADFTYGWEYWEGSDGKLKYVSPSCRDVTGYSAQDFIDRPSLIADLIVAEDKEAWTKHRTEDRSPAGMERRVAEFRIRHRDGGVRHIEHYCQSVLDNSGKYLGRRVSNIDVTARTELQRTREESEKKYRNIVEHITDGLIIHDLQGNLLECNEAAYGLLGYSREELLSKNLSEINSPLDTHLVAERLSILEDMGHIEFDAVHMRKDGSPIPVTVSAILVSTEGAGRIQSLVRDITWRKQAEMEIRRSRDELAEAQHIARLGNWSWDLETNTLTWSAEAYRLYGKSPSKYTPSFEGYLALVAPSDREKVDKAVTASLQSRGNIEFDNTIILDDGTVRVVHQSGHPVYDPSGKPVRMVGTVLDITELKMAEEASRKANVKMNLMSSITRHDMKNVMTALYGFLDLASMDKNDEKRSEYLKRAQASMRQLDHLIQFSKDYQEIGVQAPQWNKVGAILHKHEKMVTDAGRRLEVETGEVEIFADQMIEKVFYNLIDNSLRYADGGTFIRFRTEPTEGGLILICEDDGPGVPVEEKEKIFAKGFGKNTGLGLFLVREILDITGIKIRENGTHGHGARFEILIPHGASGMVNGSRSDQPAMDIEPPMRYAAEG